MQYPPAAADPVDAGLPDGGMPAAGKGGGADAAGSAENPTEPEKPGAGGKPSAGGTDPSAPGGSQSDGQTGPQGGTTISDGNRRVLEGWAAQTGRITGEPGGGARVLYFKKERDE